MKKIRKTNLIEAGFYETLAEDLSDAGQVRDGFIPHGLRHEVSVLLRSGRHLRRWILLVIGNEADV